MKRKILKSIFIVIGVVLLYGLFFRSNYHHRTAADYEKIISKLHVKLPPISQTESWDNSDRGASRWDCHEYLITFDEEYSDRTVKKFERRCKSNKHWEKELDDFDNPIYVYRSEPEWESDTYFYTCRFENKKCHIEYYIDEDEAVFNVLIFGTLLLLWLIVLAISSLVRSIKE